VKVYEVYKTGPWTQVDLVLRSDGPILRSHKRTPLQQKFPISNKAPKEHHPVKDLPDSKQGSLELPKKGSSNGPKVPEGL
jgi:hypothetical protein